MHVYNVYGLSSCVKELIECGIWGLNFRPTIHVITFTFFFTFFTFFENPKTWLFTFFCFASHVFSNYGFYDCSFDWRHFFEVAAALPLKLTTRRRHKPSTPRVLSEDPMSLRPGITTPVVRKSYDSTRSYRICSYRSQSVCRSTWYLVLECQSGLSRWA